MLSDRLTSTLGATVVSPAREVVVLDRQLAAETPAEFKHAVAELLALLVGEELVPVALLERGECPDGGAAPLGDGDPHSQDVLAGPTVVELEVRARALLTLAVDDVIGALAVRGGHAVEGAGEALYAAAVMTVELEGAKFAGRWVR